MAAEEREELTPAGLDTSRLPDNFHKSLSESIVLPYKKLVLGEQIGHGAFSRVFKGTYQGVPVAIKVMRLPGSAKATPKDEDKYLHTELAILKCVGAERARLRARATRAGRRRLPSG